MIVLAADIRRSTFLMKEAVSLRRHASTLTALVDAAAAAIRHAGGGWFDKFTGDGFLAFWLYANREWHPYIDRALSVCHALQQRFHEPGGIVDDFRANSKNLPEGVGLAMGLDAGPGQLVSVANTLTVLGAPVVGAVRMVTAAQAQETLCNVFLGERLWRERDELRKHRSIAIERIYRPGKEYPSQEVYSLRFLKQISSSQPFGRKSSAPSSNERIQPAARRARRG
jgi:class 3 adenylate cyclase